MTAVLPPVSPEDPSVSFIVSLFGESADTQRAQAEKLSLDLGFAEERGRDDISDFEGLLKRYRTGTLLLSNLNCEVLVHDFEDPFRAAKIVWSEERILSVLQASTEPVDETRELRRLYRAWVDVRRLVRAILGQSGLK